MPDPLHAKIAKAIEGKLDPDLFEQCAVDLLRDYYPNLRPLAGGNDAGQDGLLELANHTPAFLIVTTSRQYRANILKNVKSHIEGGGERRTIVVATSRPVSGRKREKLRCELREEHGVTIHDFHDRGDFIELLYRDSKWRKALLGVPGAAGALSRYSLRRGPIRQTPLTGREDDLEQLRTAEGDLIIVGKPGVGKSYLLEQLAEEDWGLFDVQRHITDLEDAIRDTQARRVIVDDVHLLEGDRTAELDRLRREMDADFAIVVVTWPGHLEGAKAGLSEATVVKLDELDRDQIVEIIREVGVQGPDYLLREINDQVQGRPGHAVLLATAALSGEFHQVMSGERLIGDLAEWHIRVTPESKRLKEVLGVLALSGDLGVSIRTIADALSVSEPDVRDAIRALAAGGLVDEVARSFGSGERRLSLQPRALRPAAANRAFFSGAASPNVEQAIECLDNATEVSRALALMGVMRFKVEKPLIRKHLAWSDLESVTTYACLGVREFDEALREAPQFAEQIAIAAYRNDVDPDRALRILLDCSLGPNGPRNFQPDDPLRVIARRLSEMRDTRVERTRVVRVVGYWLKDGGDRRVGAVALGHAVSPGFDEGRLDPGQGSTFSVYKGISPKHELEAMDRLWDEVLDTVTANQPLPVSLLIDATRPWFAPQQLLLQGSRAVDPKTKALMRETGERAIRRLADIYADKPLALRLIEQHASHPGVAIDLGLRIPERVSVFLPKESWEEDRETDWQTRNESVNRRARELAESISSKSPREIAEFVSSTHAELMHAGADTGVFDAFARHLAELSQEPAAVYEALVSNGVVQILCVYFLERVVQRRLPGCEEQLSVHLDREPHLNALTVALRYPVNRLIKRRAVGLLNAESLIGLLWLFHHHLLDRETLLILLRTENRALALHVAINILSSALEHSTRALDAEVARETKEVLLSTAGDASLWQDALMRYGYEAKAAFESDIDLFVDLLKRWIPASAARYWEFLTDEILDLIAKLPVERRVALVEEIPEGAHPEGLREIVQRLVSEDVEVMRALFARTDLTPLHKSALVGQPSELWMRRALFAAGQGWTADQIVACSQPESYGWSGRQSDMWSARVTGFEELRARLDSDDDRITQIIDSGVKHFSALQQDALEEERSEAVYGEPRGGSWVSLS